MRVFRLQAALLLMVTTAGIVMLTSAEPAQSKSLSAAKPMLADDAATWKELLTNEEMDALIGYYATQLKEWTSKEVNFVRRYYRRAQWAGHWLAMLGNAGTMKYDGDGAKKAAALREAGLALSAASKKKDYNGAKAAAEIIIGYPASIKPADDAKTAKWEDVIPLDMLMHAVSTIDTETSKAVKAEESEIAEDAAGDLYLQNLHMAALAVVAREMKDKEDWKGWCDEMREGSVALAKTIKMKSVASSKKSYDSLQESCEKCHAVYREQ